jgi:hypothetical protein
MPTTVPTPQSTRRPSISQISTTERQSSISSGQVHQDATFTNKGFAADGLDRSVNTGNAIEVNNSADCSVEISQPVVELDDSTVVQISDHAVVKSACEISQMEFDNVEAVTSRPLLENAEVSLSAYGPDDGQVQLSGKSLEFAVPFGGVFCGEARVPLDELSLEVQLSDSESCKDLPVAGDEGFYESQVSDELPSHGVSSPYEEQTSAADPVSQALDGDVGKASLATENISSDVASASDVKSIEEKASDVQEWLGQHFPDPAVAVRSLSCPDASVLGVVAMTSGECVQQADVGAGELVQAEDTREGFGLGSDLRRSSSVRSSRRESLTEVLEGDVYSQVQKGGKAVDVNARFGDVVASGGGEGLEWSDSKEVIETEAYDLVSFCRPQDAARDTARVDATAQQDDKMPPAVTAFTHHGSWPSPLPFRDYSKQSKLQRRLLCLIMDSPTPVEAMLKGIPTSLSNSHAVQTAIRQVSHSMFFRFFEW